LFFDLPQCRNRMTMPKRKSAKKRKFVYRPRKVSEFETFITRASRGDPEPLCEYLREGGLPISRGDANWLAWLLERKLPRSRGRPRGSLSSKNVAVQCASYLVRLGKRTWCEKHGKKIATKNTAVDRLIKRAIELVVPHFSLRSKINEDEVRALANLKPSYEVKQFVGEDFPEALEEIAFEALK
jgi:hypothetical protein